MHYERYDGQELRPFTGRPGCNDALLLPSKIGNQIIYMKNVEEIKKAMSEKIASFSTSPRAKTSTTRL
jgi:hypothetical protein